MLCLHPFLIVQILLLLFVANGAPLIAKKIFGGFRAHPVDAGAILRDGQRLFGPSKTIRGIIISAAATAVCAAWIGMEWSVGVLISAAAMAGDLLSSFIKRRMKLASGSMALGLDQIPESLIPAAASRWLLPVSLLDIVAVAVLFFWAGLAASRALYALNIRDKPY